MKALDISMPRINMSFVDNNTLKRIELQSIVESLEELEHNWGGESEQNQSFDITHSMCSRSGTGVSHVKLHSHGFEFETTISVFRSTGEKITYYFDGYYNGQCLERLSLKTHNGKKFSHRTKIAEGTNNWFCQHYLNEILAKQQNKSSKESVTITQAIDLLKQIL